VEDLGIDGGIVLEWMLRKYDECGVDSFAWLDWSAVVNTVMNLLLVAKNASNVVSVWADVDFRKWN
jgi:hypothetical protein